MEALDPHGGGELHASPLRPPYPASSSCGAPDTPSPNRWLSEAFTGPFINLGPLTDPEHNRTPDRATEARNGIKRRASRVLGRPTLDAGILDTSKALAGLLAQVKNAYQDRLDQIQTQLTEELQSWRAERQVREDLQLARLATLEHEVTKLRKELEKFQQPNRRQNAAAQPTQGKPAAQTNYRIQPHSQNKEPISTPTVGHNRPQSSFADIAALLATKPGGQGWKEVPRRRKRQRQPETTKQSEPSQLKPARDSPKEARRILFRRDEGQTDPRSEREDIILAVNRGLCKGGFPGFVRAIDAGYTGTGAVTVLLEKGALGSMLLPTHWDLLVAAAR